MISSRFYQFLDANCAHKYVFCKYSQFKQTFCRAKNFTYFPISSDLIPWILALHLNSLFLDVFLSLSFLPSIFLKTKVAKSKAKWHGCCWMTAAPVECLCQHMQTYPIFYGCLVIQVQFAPTQRWVYAYIVGLELNPTLFQFNTNICLKISNLYVEPSVQNHCNHTAVKIQLIPQTSFVANHVLVHHSLTNDLAQNVTKFALPIIITYFKRSVSHHFNISTT